MAIAILTVTNGFSQNSQVAKNPNNASAAVSLSWHNDVPRIRVGGSGSGAENGFDIQGSGDRSLLRIDNGGSLSTKGSYWTLNPGNPSAVVGLSWHNNIARIRVGGSGSGAESGLDIQGSGDRSLFRITDAGVSTKGVYSMVNPKNTSASASLGWHNDQLRIRVGGSGAGAERGFEIRGTGDRNLFKVLGDGKIAIGTEDPGSFKLAVNGSVRAKEIVCETGWSDFVFEEDYVLPTLKEVETHITLNGHLKDIPSAAEVAENGVALAEISSRLLQKIEELTLYTIEQEKKIEAEQKKNATLEIRLRKLEELLNE